ncbi:MAG: type I-F CRISPR-associated protein Csy2 [Desulfobacter sp.]|nr:MAG: type I-F CRISPR-associated protein Csy2 [Desulfobacter sp.]
MMNPILLIPHIQVQNANALSSPFTIGFPAMTAWLGAVHALERHLNAALNCKPAETISFQAVGVVSHQFKLHTYKGPGDYEFSIIGTGNPLIEPKNKKKNKPEGYAERPSFIEEARCHLEVSLVIACEGIDKSLEPDVIEQVGQILHSRMKIAGGDILKFQQPKFFRDFKQLKHRLMPGYALIERRELMIKAMEQGQDALDALIDYLAVHHNCEQQEKNGELEVTWSSQRKQTGPEGQRGWIVPIATGFHGISELGSAQNQRDSETPHRFAEAVVTLGEFRMSYRLKYIEDLLWHYHYDAENNLYLCQQDKHDTIEGF